LAIQRVDFPLPDVGDPLVGTFFAAAAADELRITRCDGCGSFVWYPEDACPSCGGTLAWVQVRGHGRLFSWAVVRRPFLPAFTDLVPFTTALIALDEAPEVRLCTMVVDAAPETLTVDQPMEVVFRPLRFATVPDREVVVPMFRPAERGAT
jgi:uncharacterized OB-fold protein